MPRRGLWIVPGVFAVALLLRLLFVLQLHASGLWDYLRLDPLYYHAWALRIATGDGIGTGTFEMTPLYAYLLGGLFGVAGPSLLIARCLQSFIGAGTCALIAWCGLKCFGRAEALCAGLALAAYGPSLFHETQIMKTALTMFLSTATAVALYVSEGRRPGRVAIAGALLGLTALSQENMNITLPFLLAWCLWRAPRGRRIACGGALLAAFLITVAPATVRNYALSGDFVLITSGGGEVFYTGNNEHASGRYGPPPFVRPDPFFEHEDFRAEAARRLGRPVTRKESDAFWWREGLRYVSDHPRDWLALMADKASVYFNDYERPDNYSYDNFALFVPMLRLPLVRFGWIAPFGLLGCALTLRRWPTMFPLYATMGAYALSGLLFFTQSRYRMPMVPLLVLFGAHAAVRCWSAAAARRWGALAGCLAPVIVLFGLMHRDPGNSFLFDAQNHGILGEMYLEAGRAEDAVREFRQTIRMLEDYPGDSTGEQSLRILASSHYGIALARDAGATSVSGAEVMDHLQAAGSAPEADLRHDALTELGRMRLDQGDPAGAAEAWSCASEADPADVVLRLRLAEALHRAGRPDEALAVAAAVIEGFPDADPRAIADAHFGQALIRLEDRPDPALAAYHLREVLRLHPDHPRAAWIRDRLAALDPSHD